MLCLLDRSRIHLHIETTFAQHSGSLNSLIAQLGMWENNKDLRRAFGPDLDSLLSYQLREETCQADGNAYTGQLTTDKRTRQIIIAST